jgi:hypothetical protein
MFQYGHTNGVDARVRPTAGKFFCRDAATIAASNGKLRMRDFLRASNISLILSLSKDAG